MIYHVLPGDAQGEVFQKAEIEGEVIVFREALIVGPVDPDDRDEFFARRAEFVLGEYGEDQILYQEKVADEILRLDDVTDGDEVCLWFEYELFCSVNYWFCLDLLQDKPCTIRRVAPVEAMPDDVWKGFAGYDPAKMAEAYRQRVELSRKDVETGARLWRAFATRNATGLRELAKYRSPASPFLEEVCDAAASIESRPAAIVTELIAEGLDTIETLFPEFQKRAGVYGYGDLQVLRLMEQAAG